MLKIGEFSKLSQVSVKTLRYYDEMGLLVPVEIDAFTGYRFYSHDQLPRLNRILALKDLGLSLEQIAALLEEGLPAEELRGMLRLKYAEIQQRLGEEQERLKRVEARLKQIETEDMMSNYEVVLKKVEPQIIASVRDVIPDYPEQGGLWQELGQHLARHKTTPSGVCFTIYHADEPEIDAEVCEPLSSLAPATERVKSYELPGLEQAASTVHHGPFITLSQAYDALLKWIEANGYQVSGPCRELYLRASDNGSQTDDNTVTEIQFPVSKA